VYNGHAWKRVAETFEAQKAIDGSKLDASG
jgi:hypothetical protein